MFLVTPSIELIYSMNIYSAPVVHQPSWNTGNAVGNPSVGPHRACVPEVFYFRSFKCLAFAINKVLYFVLFCFNLPEGNSQEKVNVRKRLLRDPCHMDITWDTLSSLMFGGEAGPPHYSRANLPVLLSRNLLLPAPPLPKNCTSSYP